MEYVIVLGILIFALFIHLIVNSSRNNNYLRTPSDIGKVGERDVSSILHSLPPQDYFVINDVIIPDQVLDPNKKYTTQIDHVVVSPFGVFVIETKNYSGWIFGNEKSKRWKQTFRTTQAHYLYNPIKQNWGHTYAMAEHLHLNIRVFKPIVVFSNNCTLHISSTTPVVYMSQLKGLILNYTQEIIPREEVVAISDRLNKINLNGEEIENQHLRSIGERYATRETTLQEGICPLCGGLLALRNGKFGPFYGCSNYPRCRFTQKY